MYNIKAKKKFGQNFLNDDLVLRQIIQAIPNSNNALVEIGPGLGDLTKRLLEVKNMTAFEVDFDLCKILKNTFSEEIENKKLTLIERDVLENWSDNLIDTSYDLVANLPYYIATKIILKALKDKNCKSLTVMIQKEVALKFSSQHGKKEFSALGVLAQSTGSSKLLFDVLPQSFNPPPKVTSSVLQIDKSKDLSYDEKFSEFLKTAFSQPRKKLFKNLSSKYDKLLLESIFLELTIDSNLRAHELSTLNYHLLYKNLERGGIDGEFKSK